MNTDVVELTRALVRVPSPNPGGDESAVAGALAEIGVQAGLPAPAVLERSSSRPNLLFTVDFGPGGRHLALCGHMDTKPVGDADWTADPFAAEIDGDRLYGLGSADMKGALAAMVLAAGRLTGTGGPARGRLSLLFTADEEDGAHHGAQYLAEAPPPDLPDAVLIGEPGGMRDDYDHLHLGSRGIARLRATAYGRQGHSSLSGEPGTRNAGVDAAHAAVALAEELAIPSPDDPYGIRGWTTTLNTGLAYRGGVGYGVLPGRMGVDTEVRLLPGMTREDVEKPVAALVEGVAARTGARLEVEFDEQGFLPGTVSDPDGPLPRAVRAAAGRVLGHIPPDAMFPGTTDASILQPAWNVPVLPAFGPGLLRRAHGADEWVSVTALRQAVDLYADIAAAFCAGAGR
ncbi:M20/M25/M40 family metallo-hydrolase [Actinomadura sp. 7K507]|uniref:M20 family metallopeptidase n=1 Tax=Actinomadura sp. 7K507 TaxID=2530365 RepID=UPI001047AFB2|nr:M20/M25/M40 family metallo-hydrolase [Actinomadura sp. 7K507]TDC97211.1 M20 family peptidase [Actinomadura sp. 7K507]